MCPDADSRQCPHPDTFQENPDAAFSSSLFDAVFRSACIATAMNAKRVKFPSMRAHVSDFSHAHPNRKSDIRRSGDIRLAQVLRIACRNECVALRKPTGCLFINPFTTCREFL